LHQLFGRAVEIGAEIEQQRLVLSPSRQRRHHRGAIDVRQRPQQLSRERHPGPGIAGAQAALGTPLPDRVERSMHGRPGTTAHHGSGAFIGPDKGIDVVELQAIGERGRR
jgi:hypothetical protein